MDENELKGMEEIFAEMDAERLQKEIELSQYRSEVNSITILLDSYSIPKIKDGVFLTLTERVNLAIQKRKYA